MNGNRTIPNDILLREICYRLSQGRSVKLRAKGSSMRPFILDGLDVVILAPVLTLRPGNVVLARIEDSRYVLHRIIRFDNEEIILMGDANLYGQERCRIENVFGTAVGLVRNGRQISLSSTTARLKAMLWNGLLPLRRIKHKIIK